MDRRNADFSRQRRPTARWIPAALPVRTFLPDESGVPLRRRRNADFSRQTRTGERTRQLGDAPGAKVGDDKCLLPAPDSQ